MKKTLAAAVLTALPFAAQAEPEAYTLDASHSQILFSYDHLGYSTTWNLFAGIEGDIQFDKDNPANSSVRVSFPVRSMFTGWEERFTHFMSDDFFGAEEGDMITFESTAIDVTGENSATITGDLTMNGVTKPVTLEANLNQTGDHPMANKPWAGFDATTTLLRSDYDLGAFAPAVSDEVQVQISIEAMKAE
ncbi:YceI family protein [Marivita sp. GX14005]|uniref:YceI family protein n=1 Tax=Marivita sp. GX14005 TaxID=2942276 RepID=UPI002018ED69|nr:YceI family protein [Marivita sp. GX14005]MCL3883473.1 YceI family protein [Marivita sp. GX14005]